MRKSFFLFAFAVSTFVQGHAQQVVTFPAADLVLGQANFTNGNGSVTPTASNLEEMSAVVIDPASGKVFVADSGNSRVLRYPDKDTLANGAGAEYVFGQANFTSALSSDPPSAASMNSPVGLALDGSGNLWVSDTDNNRVLMFASAVTRVDLLPTAAKVLGQAGFATRNAASPPSAASMLAPMGLHLDDAGDLWVADSANRRVLRFDNAAGLANGAAAAGVLGQGSFVTSTSGSGAGAFSDPLAVTVDGTGTLWVADRSNNRISGFPLAGSAANGTAATRVLGQSSFATVTAGLSASRFDGPSGVFADANALWVLDQRNHRALRFAGLGGIANGGAASTVVGQPDFTSRDTTVNARRFESPFVGLFVDLSGSLWVSDLIRHRVLRFDPGNDARPAVTVRGKTRLTTKRGSILLRGRASADAPIDRVIVQNQSVSFTARGTKSWKARVRLLDGRNLLRVFAIDRDETRSRPVKVVVKRL